MSTRNLLLSALLVCSLPIFVSAQEWTRFRGPNGAGISVAKGLPVKFSSDNLLWKTELPGMGHSSPVLWGDRIFLMSADPDSGMRYVLGVDANSGMIRWTKEFAASASHLHSKSSYASCTPAVDQDQLYVAWADDESTRLVALSHEGEEAWNLDLGPWVSQHGFGTSPMVHGDKVIISLMQLGDPRKLKGKPPGNSRILAVDRNSGRKIWEIKRNSDATAYSVPCIYESKNGESWLICNSSAHGIAAHDLESGKVLWEKQVFNMRSVSSPVVAGNLILGSSGSGGGGNTVSAVDPNSGSPEIAWRLSRQAAYVPTSIAKGPYVFVWSDKGIVTCLNAKSGEILGTKRVGGNYYGSPIWVDGKLYCIAEDGALMVVTADPKLEILAKNELGESSESTPAVVGDKMYLRTYSHVMAVGSK